MGSLKRAHRMKPNSGCQPSLSEASGVAEGAPSTEAPGRILRMPDVLARTGFSRSTLYRQLAAGTFPQQVRISERCIGWSDTAISAWLRDPARYGADT